MMIIKYAIRPSFIHGLGCFAVHNIKSGELIWRYDDQIDQRIKSITTMTNIEKEFINRYGYKPPGTNFIEVPGDGAIFINHSSLHPNIKCSGMDDMVASKDIKIGEEILANYYEFDTDPHSGGRLEG